MSLSIRSTYISTLVYTTKSIQFKFNLGTESNMGGSL